MLRWTACRHPESNCICSTVAVSGLCAVLNCSRPDNTEEWLSSNGLVKFPVFPLAVSFQDDGMQFVELAEREVLARYRAKGTVQNLFWTDLVSGRICSA